MHQQPAKTRPRDVLIERANHYCRMKDLKLKIGIMYAHKCEALLLSKHLEIDRKLYQLEAHRKMLKFCKMIQTHDLSTVVEEESKEPMTQVRKV